MGLTYKDLGQIAGIVYSSSAPQNETILWRDTSNNVVKYFDNNLLAWVPVDVNNAGKVAVDVGDEPNYLSSKIDTTLQVVGGDRIGVKTPVTDSDKDSWNSRANVYFVQTYINRDSLVGLKDGDRVFVVNADGAGKKESWTYYDSSYFKDFDPNWENAGSVVWGDIVNGDIEVGRVITNSTANNNYASGKLMPSTEFGLSKVNVSYNDASTCEANDDVVKIITVNCEVLVITGWNSFPSGWLLVGIQQPALVQFAQGKKIIVRNNSLSSIPYDPSYIRNNNNLYSSLNTLLPGCEYTMVRRYEVSLAAFVWEVVSASISEVIIDERIRLKVTGDDEEVNSYYDTLISTYINNTFSQKFTLSSPILMPETTYDLFYIHDKYTCTIFGSVTIPSGEIENVLLGRLPYNIMPSIPGNFSLRLAVNGDKYTPGYVTIASADRYIGLYKKPIVGLVGISEVFVIYIHYRINNQ